MKRLLFRLLAFLTAYASLTGLASLSATSPARAQGKPMRWLINGPAVPTFATDPTARAFFSNTHPFVVTRKEDSVVIPPSWGAIRTQIYPSFRLFERALANGTIKPDTKAVLYDNEAWQFTPQDEQDNFGQFARRFAELAHQHGYLVITTPAVDLAKSRQLPGEKRFDTFLRLHIPADAARYADVFDIQAQGSQVPPHVYARLVAAAAQQARAANPKVVVLAGLSTNPSGHAVTAEQISAAIRATSSIVDGYWLNVPQKNAGCPNCNDFRPDMAIEVMRQLQ